MKSYWTHATGCLVWLDRPSQADGWERVLEGVKEFNKFFKLDERGDPTYDPWGILGPDGNAMDVKMNGAQCYNVVKQFRALEEAPWFQRVWTLQEAVIPDDFVICTPERYLLWSGTMLQMLSLIGVVTCTLMDVGEMLGFSILNQLHHSELWKIMRLRQLYRKRQITYWHLHQAIKTRTCLRAQDRMLGLCGLMHSIAPQVDYTRRLEFHQDALFKQSIARSNFGSLLYLPPKRSTPHVRNRGFVLSGALAEERRESHRMSITSGGLQLQDVGVDGVTQIWCCYGRGLFAPYWQSHTPLANLGAQHANDFIKAFELPLDRRTDSSLSSQLCLSEISRTSETPSEGSKRCGRCSVRSCRAVYLCGPA